MTISTILADNAKAPVRVGWVLNKAHAYCNDPTIQNGDKVGYYTEWAKTYDNDHAPLGYAAPKSLALRLLEQLPFSPEASDGDVAVLDVACGTGRVAEELQAGLRERGHDGRTGMRLCGVDYCDAMVSLAREKNIYDEVAVGDLLHRLPYRDGEFDGFVMCGVFMPGHLGPEAVNDVARVLRVGGIGVCTVREEMFRERGVEFERVFAAAGLKITKNEVAQYLQENVAHYLTVKKTLPLVRRE